MEEKKTTIPPAVNAAMRFILRSPLHGMVSKTITLITFTGRKSGKTYSTPVSYSQKGSQVTIFTHGEWYKNLAAGAAGHPADTGQRLHRPGRCDGCR